MLDSLSRSLSFFLVTSTLIFVACVVHHDSIVRDIGLVHLLQLVQLLLNLLEFRVDLVFFFLLILIRHFTRLLDLVWHKRLSRKRYLLGSHSSAYGCVILLEYPLVWHIGRHHPPILGIQRSNIVACLVSKILLRVHLGSLD